MRGKQEKIARKKERARIKRAARQLLMSRFGVDGGVLGGYPGVVRYIRHYCPELAGRSLDGYALLYAFVGEPLRVGVNKPALPKKIESVNSDAFLASYEWRRVRMQVLKKYGARCQCCGSTPEDGTKMHVDHIKPRRLFPDLALDITNLQILCEVCNHGKGNWDMTDWRKERVHG